MRVPDFLIIGAMKAGTTTLFEDLSSHPQIFGPLDKEPDILISKQYSKEWAFEQYERLFARAKPDQLCFEASTGYTKTPQYPCAAERAMEVCGPDLKVIYIVRDPVQRITSHHHHAGISRAAGLITEPLEEAIEIYPELKDWSRYMIQLRPWVEMFGEDNVTIVPFERYTKDRRHTVDAIQRYLGIEPRPELVDVGRIANISSRKISHNALTRRISRIKIYRSILRPMLPERLRKAVFRVFGRTIDRPHARFDKSTADRVRIELQAEYDEAIRRYGIVKNTEAIDGGAAGIVSKDCKK